jgi:hypothetical protein
VTGAAGAITPTRTFLAPDGAYCRGYDETITARAVRTGTEHRLPQ